MILLFGGILIGILVSVLIAVYINKPWAWVGFPRIPGTYLGDNKNNG